MQRTIFNTPVVRHFLRYLSLFFLKLLGWKTSGQLPDAPKYVIIVAPHTSNWDLFYGAIIALSLKLDARFMAKHQLFRKPFGPLMKWLGGVPIDRSASHHTVDQVIRKFNENETFVLAIAPEGTRRKVNYWKSGFYHIAEGARVPILLGFLDYAAKTGGAGPLIMPSGDMDHDMGIIRSFYQSVTGKHDDKTGPLAILHKT
ncbi:MAG TPA: lysophospholipid acyltransferase family protein [Spirochaetota bacterium]|nr:lysophospholipid acyltransferase family protein [Spirochaetota bacterium]HPL19057.1 lysophospholipid acyltransferase family protein [Spirochaetota bacterium]HQF10424.1 lysophospholipid acyltransferase family protein [Spirochaetota bacterium]HQJ72979.1 lysophospholipid acyltransferase family protein [Spirochaetota bacterium]